MLQLESSDRTQTFATTARVGRHPANDLVLECELVSGHHAVVEYREGAWRVRDLGSRNGTTVNGRRILTWRSLAEGDVVRFADEAWRVLEASPPNEHAPLVSTATTSARPGQARLVLRWTGPAEGEIEVHVGDEVRGASAGLPFLLLDLLAERGDWVDDDEIKRHLWGRQRLSRSSYSTLFYTTRRLLEAWGMDRRVLVKERGRARLVVTEVKRELFSR